MAPDDEAMYLSRLKQMDNLGDRAFDILMNLGIIQSSPDPNSPDYDPSLDDEIVEGIIYLDKE